MSKSIYDLLEDEVAQASIYDQLENEALALATNENTALEDNTDIPEEEPQENWGELIGKSLVSGALSFADLPVVLFGLGELGIDFAKGNKLKTPKSFDYLPSNYLKQGVEAVTGWNPEPSPKTTGGRLASGLLQGLSGGVSGGGAAKLATKAGLSKLGTALGAEQSLKELGTTGAAVGGLSEGLQESGLDPITAGLGASFIAPKAQNFLTKFSKPSLQGIKDIASKQGIKDLVSKAQLYPLGLSPKKFDLDLYEAAQRSGIELPAAAYTDSRLAHLANQVIGATPYYGDKIKAKSIAADSKIKDKLENILSKVGPENTPETEMAIRKEYAIPTESLPANADASPIFTLPESDKIIKKFKGVSLAPGAKKVNKMAEEIYRNFNDPEAWQHSDIKIPVEKFITQKQQINANPGVWEGEADAMHIAQLLSNAANNDIGIYGLKNPEWYKSWQKAEKFYGRAQDRKALDKILGKGINEGTDTVSHANLSKAVHTQDKAQKIKDIIGNEEAWQEIADLGAIGRGMSRKNLSTPNPSGTTTTALANASGLGALYGLYNAPTSTVSSLLGANHLTNLLTDQKYIDTAAKFARNKKAQPKTAKSSVKKAVRGAPGLSAVITKDSDERKRKRTYSDAEVEKKVAESLRDYNLQDGMR